MAMDTTTTAKTEQAIKVAGRRSRIATPSVHVLEADAHQFGQCRNYPGRNNHPRNEVVGQISSQFVVGEMVRIDASCEQRARLLPRRVVTSQEYAATPHHRRDGAIRRGVNTGLILDVGGIMRSRFGVFDQRIGFELPASEASELILVPCGLIVERKLC
jgi:hypothetical protein